MGTIWVLPKNSGPNLQHQKIGGAQFIRPDLPGPDLPGFNLPGPDLPGPNLPPKIAQAQFATNKISGAQFAAPKNFRGPICRNKISKGPNLPPRGPICRGPICRGPICRQGAQSAGARFAKKWQIGPQKVWGPICRQIGEGPNLPGPNLPGPNLPRTFVSIQRATGVVFFAESRLTLKRV